MARFTHQQPHRWRRPASLALILLLGLNLGPVGFGHGQAATIYRTVDAEGQPVFSDTPPPPGRPVEIIVVEEAASFDADPLPAPASDWAGIDSTAAPAAPGYDAVAVQWPGNDEAVRENSGNITVVALVDPALRPGHSLVLLMDDRPVASSIDGRFALTEVDRGTHTLAVQVVDGAGAVLASSEPSVFHLLRVHR
jgi:hypothetical protein